MNRFELFKLRYNIRLRKCLLNNMLCILSPRNKIVIRISQNLDKHIVKYQKKA
ncbi:Spo0E family sporulation regulatory protein-aspartic acid phosphatase [Clostridium beijerinckii]|uniref:Spo0E family sporulation regulatory protein-aspartic acid phosphatase n=5 Tax=Clostridium TaxID=1485 RepID=A0AAV3W2T2_9CLOT|nr:Spo0E family sporulation regulatory protein-aspartic acid phosphatase [Clostridium beijerinckii NRRL B-598]MBC2419263.1 Spo0E family sporulation regulatory protein-aspartic acid phosphatase [Clostridium beijerinckii]OVE66022.1 Spo0E family sporulation regulatory protein-aspartic acid phosphatase [Clostridium diolis]MBC2424741.1 Spo0E family sporulation regulatory protein-aspartic acid phosphatase [Clostridium beijerinckii]MBC2434166.1 Spo0E family sporulation regulatory protein-aspartic acid